MIDGWIKSLSALMANNIWLGFLIAFVVGILTFFTPCALTSVPMIVGYVGGTSSTRKKAFAYSLIVVLGETIVFLAIGVATYFLGDFILLNSTVSMIFFIVLGAFMFVMALEMWGVINIFGKACGVNIKTTKKGVLGAFLIGLLGGIIASPCDWAALAAILGLITTAEGGIFVAIGMMLLYALGRGILLVIAGTSIGFARQMSESPKFEKASKIVKIILGIFIFALGVYMILVGVL